MKKNIKKHSIIKYAVCIILIVSCIIIGVYSYYGGLGTGKCANVNEFEKYAVTVEDLSIPEQTKIVALGEATHGNKEFQQLKLDILYANFKFWFRSSEGTVLSSEYICH